MHEIEAGSRLAPVWPGVPRLALASNAQIYPWLLNGNSVMAFAEGVAREAALRLELGASRVREAVGKSGVASQSGNRPAPEVF